MISFFFHSSFVKGFFIVSEKSWRTWNKIRGRRKSKQYQRHLSDETLIIWELGNLNKEKKEEKARKKWCGDKKGISCSFLLFLAFSSSFSLLSPLTPPFRRIGRVFDSWESIWFDSNRTIRNVNRAILTTMFLSIYLVGWRFPFSRRVTDLHSL